MLRIRRIYDDALPVNKEILRQVREILKSRFRGVPENEIANLGERLRNPFKKRFCTSLFVAETLKGKVQGFATILHEPEIGFVFLDWIAMASGKGVGRSVVCCTSGFARKRPPFMRPDFSLNVFPMSQRTAGGPAETKPFPVAVLWLMARGPSSAPVMKQP